MTGDITMETVELSEFQKGAVSRPDGDCWIVVKSQDQLERQQRLIQKKEDDRMGRIEQRPIAEGLLLRTELAERTTIDADTVSFCQTLREPRGFAKINKDSYLVSEIDRVNVIDRDGTIHETYTHDLFAFLHSVEYNSDRNAFLTVSAGYDSIVEVDLETGEPLWTWTAWNHGFTTRDGTYLALTDEKYNEHASKGREVEKIDPAEYGSHGLLTSRRTNHPSCAIYGPGDDNRIVAIFGHSAELVRIDRDTGEYETIFDELESLPHAIQRFGDHGWLITNTMAGEVIQLDDCYDPVRQFDFSRLGGKLDELAEHEWVQAVYPWAEGRLLAIDANRGGLINVDIENRKYEMIPCNDQYCVHRLFLEN